jgi:hypothetical protein
MKQTMIKPDKTATPVAQVEHLMPQQDRPVQRRAQTVTLSIGGRRYELTLHSEFCEITKGPAKIIEMPGRA